MEGAVTSTPRRVLRVLLASGFLALGWVAVDLIAHSEPAAAAQTIDLLPLVDETAATVTDTVEAAVAPVITTVAEPVEPLVSAVVAEAISPLVTGVVAPVVEPVLEATEPIVAPIVTPILLPIIDVVDDIAPVVSTVTSAVENERLLFGSALVVGSLLAASIVPLIPAPTNGGPLKAPLAPNAPTGSNSSVLVAIYGELNSGIRAAIGALRTSEAVGYALPPSPTFAFDTTPD